MTLRAPRLPQCVRLSSAFVARVITHSHSYTGPTRPLVAPKGLFDLEVVRKGREEVGHRERAYADAHALQRGRERRELQLHQVLLPSSPSPSSFVLVLFREVRNSFAEEHADGRGAGKRQRKEIMTAVEKERNIRR